MARNEIRINSRTLIVSNLEKVLYPASGFTKGQVIDYYEKISRVLLPHLRNRPLTLKRYPNGVDQEFFYERNCPSHRPRWMQVARVWSETKRRSIAYCLVNDLPSLIWVVNLANLELHTSLARRQNTEKPTALVLDLDPGPGTNILDCARVALALRALLSKLHLRAFPKTSGSKGMQLFVPLNSPATFNETKALARSLASEVAAANPKSVVTQMAKRLRKNRVFIDWSQNSHHKTTVVAYSLRAKASPLVSTPLTWKELETRLNRDDPKAFEFSPEQVLERVRRRGDLFQPVLTLRQRLPKDLSAIMGA